MPSFPMIPRFSLAGQDQCSVANIPTLGQSWPMLGRQHPNARTILANARSPTSQRSDNLGQCSVANVPTLGQSWPMLGRQHPNARSPTSQCSVGVVGRCFGADQSDRAEEKRLISARNAAKFFRFYFWWSVFCPFWSGRPSGYR
jgi:hypothetical protein